jgi:hypothetical protein
MKLHIATLVSLWILLLLGIPVDSACSTPLDDIFNGDIYDDNANGEILAIDGTPGDANRAGDVDIWADNDLHSGDIDGDVIGTSSGACTLLPTLQVWMCQFQLDLEDGSLIVSGLSANSLDTKQVTITGGTGCYEGIGGTIEMTALEVVVPYDYYKYKLISYTEADAGNYSFSTKSTWIQTVVVTFGLVCSWMML